MKMHTIVAASDMAAGVPAFLAKLWRLVEDEQTNHLIYWSRDGNSFIIQNQAEFARELLPLNYKHNNMASFIRQLNMYGFHKITSIENGGLKFDRDEIEFSHEFFQRGHRELLEHIKRKIANSKQTVIDQKSVVKPETFSRVLSEVKIMKGRQGSLDSRFSAIKQENEALWREVAILRQKHMKQQRIVNQLIQFLVTIVQPQGQMGAGVERRYPLMINDVPGSSKSRKRSHSSGPVVHELDEDVDESNVFDEIDDEDVLPKDDSPVVLSPNSQNTTQEMASELLGETFDSQLSDDLDEQLNSSNIMPDDLDDFVLSTESTAEPQLSPDYGPVGKYSKRQAAVKAKDNIKAMTNEIVGGKRQSGVVAGRKQLSTQQQTGDKSPEPLMLVANNEPVTTLNKDDVYASTDVPADIFDADTSDDDIIRGSYNPTLSEDYTKKLQEPGPSTNDLTLAKFNKYGNHEDILKLNSPEDIHYHLENTQGDLENLKEFLRNNDNYQVDANSLLNNGTPAAIKLSPTIDCELLSKLFNDHDILPSYGLSIPPELLEKKSEEGITGSELTTYQPSYNNIDLSDLLNMPDNMNSFDNVDSTSMDMMPPKSESSLPLNIKNSDDLNTPSSSELNTPYIEKEAFFTE